MTWDRRFLQLANHVAQWSKDPSTKVGAVLVDDQRRVIGMGYNGFPRGVQDLEERYEFRARKYAMVVHAEANAVLNATRETRGAIAYVTHHPCSNCMGILIQAGIRHIVTTHPDPGLEQRLLESFEVARIMADEAGITIDFMEPDYV